VLFFALPLAFGAFSTAIPASSLAIGAAVAVCFEPEEDCTAFAVDAIDRAETQILVHAYGLTTNSTIVEALVRARQRGVEVKLIADRTAESIP
jgi:phosphatidylserine/phosphatidylglycerophosphate/cardiolipin synthase-like enzyme